MKKIAVIIIACLLGGYLILIQARANGQAHADHLDWLTSLPQAQAEAKAQNKLVLVNFTGSDWCPWCIKMDNDTYSQPAFADYASKNLVLVTVDFPRKKPQTDELIKANQALMEKYEPQGALPTQIAMKPDGTVVWKNEGYLAGGPAAIIAQLDQAKNK